MPWFAWLLAPILAPPPGNAAAVPTERAGARGPLEVTLEAPRLQVGELTEVRLVHRNVGRTPLTVATGRACGSGDLDVLTLDGEDARVATLTDCATANPDALETLVLAPGRAFTTQVALVPASPGLHRLEATYRLSDPPAGVFSGEARSAPLEVDIQPPDPPGPVIELELPRAPRAGRPFAVVVKHVNRGSRGWILFNERCGGFPRDFVVVDGEAHPIQPTPHCRLWDDRMTLEPGRAFRTRLVLTLPAGTHPLQGQYRLGDEYRDAVVWKGEAVSPILTVTVSP